MYPYPKPSREDTRRLAWFLIGLLIITIVVFPITGLLIILTRGWDNTPQWVRSLWVASIVIVVGFIIYIPINNQRQQVELQAAYQSYQGVSDTLNNISAYTQELDKFDSQIVVQVVKTSLEDKRGEWDITRTIQISNNSQWPLRIWGIYWAFEGQPEGDQNFSFPMNIRDRCVVPPLAWPNQNIEGQIKGSTITGKVTTSRAISPAQSVFEENTVTLLGQEASSTATYNCPTLDVTYTSDLSDYLLNQTKQRFQSSPACVVFYPFTQSAWKDIDAPFMASSPGRPLKTICSGQTSMDATPVSKEMVVGETRTMQIDPQGEQQVMLHVNGANHVSIRITADKPGTPDTSLEVLDGQLRQIAHDDDSGGNLNPYIASLSVRSDAIYTVVINAASKGGTFTISVQKQD